MQFKHFAVAAAVIALSTGAQATSTLQVSIINFTASVSGGIFRWASSNGTLGASVQDLNLSSSFTGHGDAAGHIYFDSASPPLTDSATIPADNDAAISSPMGVKASSTFGAALSTLAVSTGAAGGYAEATSNWTGQFFITPGATVTFEWDTQLYGVNSTDAGYIAGPFSQMAAAATVSVGAQSRQFQYDTHLSFFPKSAFTLGDNSIEHQSLVFKNVNPFPIIGAFKSDLKAYTRDVKTPPVPEPESLALAAGGLLTLGLLNARRRRQH